MTPFDLVCIALFFATPLLLRWICDATSPDTLRRHGRVVIETRDEKFWELSLPLADGKDFMENLAKHFRSIHGKTEDEADVTIEVMDDNSIPAVRHEGLLFPFTAFLTHDWRVDSLGRNNHERVVRIEEALREKHRIRSWIDKDQIKAGDFRSRMKLGIDRSALVVVFVTPSYIEKVNNGLSNDNCKVEFDYAVSTKTNRKILPVVMDPQCTDPSEWGQLGFEISASREIYVDFTSDKDFDANVEHLARMIRAKLEG